MKVSISQAARMAGISRQHFYDKYVNKGVVSVERDNPAQPLIDVSELLRVFTNIKLPDNEVSPERQELTLEFTRKLSDLDKELQVIRQQLTASQEREKWLQGHCDKLTDSLKLLESKPAAQEPVKWWRLKLW